MFIPFLAAATIATAFAQLGAMTVKISVLTKALQALSIAFIVVVIADWSVFGRGWMGYAGLGYAPEWLSQVDLLGSALGRGGSLGWHW